MTKAKLLWLVVVVANFLHIAFTHGGQHGRGGGGSPGRSGYDGDSQGGPGQHGGGTPGGPGQHGGGSPGGPGHHGSSSQGGSGQHSGGSQGGPGQHGGSSQGGSGHHGGGSPGGLGHHGGSSHGGSGQHGGSSHGRPGHHGGDSQGRPGHHGGGLPGVPGHRGGSSHGGPGHYGGGSQGGSGHQGGGSHGGPGHHGGGSQGGPGHNGGVHEVSVIPRCLLEEVSSFLTGNGISGSSNVTLYIPRCRLDHTFECHQQWPALGLSWRANSQGRMMENTLTKGTPQCSLKKVSRKAFVCIPGETTFRCKRGTTISYLDIRLSRTAAPGHKCHRGRNDNNSTLPNYHRCNATKVIGKISKRCQGRRECWINLSERYLGKACVKEVKFLRINFTCDHGDINMTEESEIKEDPMFSRWVDMDEICTDDDSVDVNDEVDFDDDDDSIRSSGDSDMDSDKDDDDDSGDYNGDDNDDDVFFLDENDENVGDTFDDDVIRFQSMNFLGSSILLDGMRRGVERGRQHCPRVNWLKEPDLYKEFNFNPPSVCPKNEPMQSKCSPNLCKLVKCRDDKNVSCRVNPCGSCRPECYDVEENRVQGPRALTTCENKRLEIKYRHSDEVIAVPRCNEDGSFAEIQCLPRLNKCWCVDKHGRERNGTRQNGKPGNCKASGPVLSLCQSSLLNIKNLKEHLRKMSVNYNKTAQTLKSKAENMTKLLQQQPNQQQNQSGLHHQQDIRHQRSRARMCRVVARNTMKMVKHLAEPQCDADGNYESIQCESSGKWCWCVNENGRRVGPIKPRKKLNCSSIDKRKENVCPKLHSFGSGAGYNKPCRDDSDCSDSKVCCKTSKGERGCVDPPPKMPDIKPGKCPKMPKSTNYSCASKCKTDADCRGDMKCCGMGCGKRCIPANKPVCPKDKPFKLCIYDKCLSSPGCPSHPSACCRMNYCGGCTAEYFDENDRKIDCSKATQCQKQRHEATENYKRMFLQVYGTMPLVVPGSLQERNRTVQGERRGGNQGGRQGENQGGRQQNGNGEDQGGMPGGNDRGRHSDGQSGAPSDSQQDGNEGSQGAQHSSQSSSGGGERVGRHRTGRGQGSGEYHSGSREGNGGRNSGEQNLPADRRVRQNQDQRRTPDLGVFIPECNQEDGAFLPEQCNVTAGVCWCVDEKGHEKPKTRSRVQPGTRDCKDAISTSNEDSKELFTEGAHGQKNKGHQKRKRVARINIRLMGNFEDIIKNKEQFINNFKDKVVSITKIKKEQIQNVEISRGSIKVQFDIVEEEDSAPLEEIVDKMEKEVTSKDFTVKMDDKEYRSDGKFRAEVDNPHDENTIDSVDKRQLSPVEAIAIGSCAIICLLGTAVFVWRLYCRGRKKLEPVGWKDMGEKKPPEVQFYIPEAAPAVTTSMGTPSSKVPSPRAKAVEAMPEPSI